MNTFKLCVFFVNLAIFLLRLSVTQWRTQGRDPGPQMFPRRVGLWRWVGLTQGSVCEGQSRQ